MIHVPHLALESRTEIPRIRELLLEGDVLFANAFDEKAQRGLVLALDVRDPKAPRVLSQVALPRSISHLAHHRGVLYGVEHYRAIDMIDVRDPLRIEAFDCELTFGRSIEDLCILGDVLVARNDNAIESWSITDPRKPVHRSTFRMDKLELGGIAAGGDRLYCATKKAGLLVFEAEGDTFVEVGRTTVSGFAAEQVHVTRERVFLFGSGKREVDLVVCDRSTLRVLFEGASGIARTHGIRDTQDGGLIVFGPHYQASLLAPDGGSKPLFEQFETQTLKYVERQHRHVGNEEVAEDEEPLPETSAGTGITDEELRRVSCMETVSAFVRHDRYAIAAQGEELIVYSIRPSSPLADVV